MQGDWTLMSVTGKEESDKASGNKFTFEEETSSLPFGKLKGARHKELFGRLKLHAGKTEVFSGEGKLIQSDTYPEKQGAVGTSKFQFVPTSRLDAKEFGRLYGNIGVALEAEFWHVVQAGEQTGVEPEPLDDDNVRPESTAAHMKQAAAKKVATA